MASTPSRIVRRACDLRRAGTMAALTVLVAVPSRTAAQDAMSEGVVITRTEYGVPHVSAPEIGGVFFGLAYAQLEDHGMAAVTDVVVVTGRMGEIFGPDSAAADPYYAFSRKAAGSFFPSLDEDTQAAYAGFAAGINQYVSQHPEEFPPGLPRFTGADILARDVIRPRPGRVQAFRSAQSRKEEGPEAAAAQVHGLVLPTADFLGSGSSAWAIHGSRTVDGHALLFRSPHLPWTARLYEAHLTVPGQLDFYGDFRLGGPLVLSGGFNGALGWATTDNDPDLEVFYALATDPTDPTKVMLDGTAHRMQVDTVITRVRTGGGFETRTDSMWSTPVGEVVLRDENTVYVVKMPHAGRADAGTQFLRMMRASSYREWMEAMRIRAHVFSNFVYADRAGNIFYLWNAAIPELPHPHNGSATAVPIRRTGEAWATLVPFDRLPQLLNPPGGYVQNANDSFHFTNLEAPFDARDFPANFPPPSLRIRSQHSLELVGGQDTLSLARIASLKNSARMLLAERVKEDLLGALRGLSLSPDERLARRTLLEWNNSAEADARGGVLFATWVVEYARNRAGQPLWAEDWSAQSPTTTPRGLASPDVALEAFRTAVAAVRGRYGRVDPPWGAVNHFTLRDVTAPASGCNAGFGCFRVVWFRDSGGGPERTAWGGEAWTLAVSFAETPRARSILAYGESSRRGSSHATDQLRLFATGGMKPVRFSRADIDANAVRRYAPGTDGPVGRKPLDPSTRVHPW